MPNEHFPRGNRLSALEKNELKQRALEMVLVLFYVEDLKMFVVESIRATDGHRSLAQGGRLPPGTKRLYEKAWSILVDFNILTKDESNELQKLIDYRNFVAHQTYSLTADVGRYTFLQLTNDAPRYEHNALHRVKYFHKKISSEMRHGFVLSISFRSLHFDAAERTYLEELAVLKRKIRRQTLSAQKEIDQANEVISKLNQSHLLTKLQPGHPDQISRSGRFTKKGLTCCRGLFEAGASPFVVAHMMQISLRAATRQHRQWLTEPILGL